MAEMALTVVVSPLMGVVFDKLRSPILREFGSLYGINDDLEKLSSALSRIRAVLEDAEKKQITDKATKDWLGKIKDAAYEADDIIDECATKALFSLDSGVNLGRSSSSTQAGISFLPSINFKPLKLRCKIAKAIKKISTKLDDIAAEKDKFQLREGVLESFSAEFMQQRETSSVLCESVVYGRNKDKDNFVRLLLSSSNGGDDLQVYPIVGIGGLGKTTLAQLIYSDESIVEAFTTRIWICISEDFSVKRLTKKIITSLSGAECGLEDLDPLQNHLKQLLNEKKFLLNERICSLKNLQTLDLRSCGYLQKLPKYISKLVNLRHLDLGSCQRIQLPDGIGELINLRHLNLRSCRRLIELPEGVGDLINLRYMDLSYCDELIQLPQRIGKLVDLIHLNLCACRRLIELPEGVGDLINLRYMDLSGCSQLIHLPQRIGELINLRHLKLGYKLSQMPVVIGKLICLEMLWSFAVGREDSGGSTIRELHGLNHLRGYLEIRRLEHVRNGAESEQANLAAKKNLSSLQLQWGDISSNSEDVIQGLQPCHENLQKLCIENYGGTIFPSWMKLLVNLVEITLLCCSKCEDLPPLGQLPLLKTLSISRMDSLKRINKEFYGISSSSEAVGGFFPSLEILDLQLMPNWEEWESLDQQQLFLSLKELRLRRCPSLASIPFSIQRSVQKMVVSSCSEELMLTSLPCVRVLELGGLSSVGSLQNLDALESLTLSHCKFASIPQQMELSSLKFLTIDSCSFLTTLSQTLQHLSSLNTLAIIDCNELEFSSADFLHLLSLKNLNLVKLPKLTSLPDLPHHSSLQSLNIQQCHNLKVLLPQWIHYVTSLDRLTIVGCDPDLELKCTKGKGEYWPYISHIQNLDIRSSSRGSGYSLYGGGGIHI